MFTKKIPSMMVSRAAQADKKSELNSSLAYFKISTSNIRSNTKSTSTKDGNKKPTRIGIVQHVKIKNDFLLCENWYFPIVSHAKNDQKPCKNQTSWDMQFTIPKILCNLAELDKAT